MSNSLAIAAVTATLRNLLTQRVTDDPDLADTTVTTQPPDKARNANNTANQLNLFLYQTVVDAALRNMDMPRQVKPGETGQPPLPLVLYYLIIAYGRNDDDVFSHRLLGRAMSVLHDHPLLGAEEIRAALPDNDLHEQVERVRMTPQSLSLEELSKLWTTFQTQYRISAAYQVAVVLIESTRPARAPLPVLKRGQDDQGITSQPDLTPPFPTITDVHPPNQQSSARLGDILTLSGYHLDGADVAVEIRHPRIPNAIILVPEPGATATDITVRIPNQPNNFPAGLYVLAVIVTRPGETFSRRTNELPFMLAPQVEPNPPINALRNGDTVTISLTCNPRVLPEQRVALLLGEDEILAAPHPAATNDLQFPAKDVPAGKFPAGARYFVRLRIDGVDSLLVIRTGEPPTLQFDPNQQVTIP